MKQELNFRRVEVFIKWQCDVYVPGSKSNLEGATLKDLSSFINLSPKQAERHLDAYMKENPGVLISQGRPKTYYRTANAKFLYGESTQMDFFELLRLQNPDILPLPNILLERHASIRILKLIVKAISRKQPIDVSYRSLNHPDGKERIIHPHCIFYGGGRLYVRAYCEKNEGYLSFALSRINELTANHEEERTYMEAANDTEWHEAIEIQLIAHPNLKDNVRSLIEEDYAMENGIKRIRVPKALVGFWLQDMHILPDYPGKPLQRSLKKHQYLAIKNWEEVEPFRFDGAKKI